MLGKHFQIKKIAERVFSEYGLCVPVDFGKFPSDVLTITTEELDLHTDGYVVLNSKLTEIKINRLVTSKKRKRFTIGHELGHYFIPWHNGTESCTMNDLERTDITIFNNEEKEADLFAAFLLMPDSFLLQILEEFKHEPLQDLLRSLITKADVSLIAAVRGLSRVATGYCAYLVERKDIGNSIYPSCENLTGSLYGIDKKDYLNTVCVDQSTATYFSHKVTFYKMIDIPERSLITECYNTYQSLDECYDKLTGSAPARGLHFIEYMLDVTNAPYFVFMAYKNKYITYKKKNECIDFPSFKNKDNLLKYCQWIGWDTTEIQLSEDKFLWFVKMQTLEVKQVDISGKNAKVLLDIILEETSLKGKRQRIEGIMGQVNSKYQKNEIHSSPDTLYHNLVASLKNKEDLRSFCEHPSFEEFIYKKYCSLFLK